MTAAQLCKLIGTLNGVVKSLDKAEDFYNADQHVAGRAYIECSRDAVREMVAVCEWAQKLQVAVAEARDAEALALSGRPVVVEAVAL